MKALSPINTAASLMIAIAALAGMSGAVSHRAAAATSAAAGRPAAGNPVAGRMLYQACSGCHSLDENDVGPGHRGVVGRKAGAVTDYAYSAAIRKSGIVWTPANLDRWLTNPQKLVPGSKMYFSVANPKQRADIIAYLAQQH
jgi:cytochrome c